MKTKSNLLAPLSVGFLIGAITIVMAVLVWNHDSPSGSRSSIPTYGTNASSAAAPATMDLAVFRVAARFVCSCGTCGEKRLDVCSCATAQQERAFIQDQLRNGHSEAEAAEAVNKKYGGLKS